MLSVAFQSMALKGHGREAILAWLEPQHGMPGSNATRAPTANRVAPAPTPTTSLCTATYPEEESLRLSICQHLLLQGLSSQLLGAMQWTCDEHCEEVLELQAVV